MRKPEVDYINGVTVVAMGTEYAELDSSAIKDLKEVQHAVEESDLPRMVINLRSVSNIDVAFLDFLFELNECLRFQIEGRLGVCNASQHCRELLLVGNRGSILDVFETCEEAVAAYVETS